MEIWLYLKGILLRMLFTWHTVSAIYCFAPTHLAIYRGVQVAYHHTNISITDYTTMNYSAVNVYLGVPFAKPPVGPLRFKKPEPREFNANIYSTAHMRPPCMQFTSQPFPWYDARTPSEDCLYLNVWVPVERSRSYAPLPGVLPVMVWISGGGFTVGSNRDDIYNGTTLAAEGGVIVVTINYRMGVFGFLTSGTEEAPGNYGMYDMLEALKWVNQNIAFFGGDPNRVTLVGQGAGSIAVGLLCVSPLARPYFHRVIMQSGSPAYTDADYSTMRSVATSQKLAEAVGCAHDSRTIQDFPENVVECLRGVDAMNLTRTLNAFHPNSLRSFLPLYGDEILPRNARRALVDGDFANVPVLIGNNADEGASLLTTGHPDAFGFFGHRNQKVNKTYGRELLRDYFYRYIMPGAMIRRYLGHVDDGDFDRIRRQVYTAMGDWSLLCPTVYFAESYSRAGNDVYFYYFEHRPSNSPWADWMGAVHFAEVKFVFGHPLHQASYTRDELKLSLKMIAIWTEFVRSGVITHPDWMKYSRENPIYMRWTTEPSDLFVKLSPKYGEGPHKANCDSFRIYHEFN